MPKQAHDSRTILITGGAGFVGSNIADALIARGTPVRILDNFSTGRQQNVNPQAQLVRGDLRDPDRIRAAFSGVDCVFHTAALPRVPLSIEKPLETHMVNVVGTLNVLTAAREAGVRRVIFSGSSSVYGDQRILPLREDMCPNPLNPYALQKLTAEQYTRMFCRFYGLETLTLRYFNVFGPRMAVEGAYVTVMAVFVRARLEGKELTIDGDGEQTRDFTHVSDVVSASLLAIDCAGADGRAINVGRGAAISINRVAEIIGGATIHRPPRPGDARHTLADISEAERVLGWRPKVDTEQAIRELMRSAGL